MQKLYCSALFLCSVLALGACGPLGISYGGPASNDFIEVNTIDDLEAVRQNLSGRYRLMQNISLDAIANWQPIGDELNPFNGEFNGNNSLITNLSSTGYDYAGLFGRIGEEARIYDLGVHIVDVSGITRVGALAGNNAGLVERVYAVGGEVTAMDGHGGGLIGRNEQNAVIRLSFATPRVVAHNIRDDAGGLVGQNYGLIEQSYATGDSRATGQHGDSGGLVGNNNNLGRIINSYATGNAQVEGSSGYAGGLVGRNDEDIQMSYATGVSSFLGGGGAGGLIGRNDGGSISDSYRVQSGGGVFGSQRSIESLRCPTAPNANCNNQGPTYANWSSDIWDFGTSDDLPIPRNLPACPPFLPECRS